MDTTSPQTENKTRSAESPAGSQTTAIYRPADDRMLAGVASGFARYLRIDVLLVRIAFVVLCFAGGIGVPLYLASWLLIPEEGAERSIATGLLSDARAWRQ